jgi:glycosyltransferase involved in cell wall biosynthesis
MPSPSPTISVVLTTRNRDAELMEALSSLQHQTVPLHEVLVVDDGGSGSAREAVAPFREPFKYLWQHNQGMQAARNTGAAAATGDWIAFLDDDDIWEPNRHSLARRLMLNQEIDLIAGNFRKFGHDWIETKGEFSKWPAEFWPVHLLEEGVQIVGRFPPHKIFPQHPFWPSTLIVKRSLFTRIGGWDTRMNGVPSEDFHFVYRAFREASLGLILEPTVRYRVHQGNAKRQQRVALGRLQIFDEILANVETLERERCRLLEKEPALLVDAIHAVRRLKDRDREIQLSRRLLACAWGTELQRLRLAARLAFMGMTRVMGR